MVITPRRGYFGSRDLGAEIALFVVLGTQSKTNRRDSWSFTAGRVISSEEAAKPLPWEAVKCLGTVVRVGPALEVTAVGD